MLLLGIFGLIFILTNNIHQLIDSYKADIEVSYGKSFFSIIGAIVIFLGLKIISLKEQNPIMEDSGLIKVGILFQLIGIGGFLIWIFIPLGFDYIIWRLYMAISGLYDCTFINFIFINLSTKGKIKD